MENTTIWTEVNKSRAQLINAYIMFINQKMDNSPPIMKIEVQSIENSSLLDTSSEQRTYLNVSASRNKSTIASQRLSLYRHSSHC